MPAFNSSFCQSIHSHDESPPSSPVLEHQQLDVKLEEPPVSRKRRRSTYESGDRFIHGPTSIDPRMVYTNLPDKPGASYREPQVYGQQGSTRRANQLYRHILASEYTPQMGTPSCMAITSHGQPPPSKRCNKPRVFTYYSENSSRSTLRATLTLDSTEHQAYSRIPLSVDTRKQLLRPMKKLRSISTVPFRVLDAPDLVDNFYLNLIDWSDSDNIAAVLNASVYIYAVADGNVEQLVNMTPIGSIPTSVHWLGKKLVVGEQSGNVSLWDAESRIKIRQYHGHEKRVGTIASSGNIIATGSKDSTIFLRDTRDGAAYFRKITAHSSDVCGLRFSTFDEPVLASGGDDCKLYIWDLRNDGAGSSSASSLRRGRLSSASMASTSMASIAPPSPMRYNDTFDFTMAKSTPTPIFRLTEHRAAVKGLAWSPHQRGLLASGGGRQDRMIRFWNTTTGTKVGELKCDAQVTNLGWSTTSDEIVSTHGYANDNHIPGQISVWHYPTRTKNVSFIGHTDRVLYLALSPNGTSIATASGDQTLRFWNVFPPKQKPVDPAVERDADLAGKIR